MATGGKTRSGPGKAALLLLLALLFATCLPAQARSWRIANFDATVRLDERGRARITERISLVFIGQFQGIHRNIPVEYPGPNDTNYTLFLNVTSVTDGDGRPLEYEESTARGKRDLKIYVPGASDSTREVQISYEVPNAVRWFETYDEFYWNVTGNDWPVPIDRASATVYLPASGAGQYRVQAFTGVYGSYDQEVSATIEGAVASFATTNPLPMRGGLTLDVYIPKGVLKPPSQLATALWFIRSNPIVLLPLAAFVVMFGLWWVKGRDPDIGLSVAPVYEPPTNFTPAEVGAMVDDSVDPRDITSTLVDLAVRGYLRIEEKKEKALLFTTTDYVFHSLKPRSEWEGLAPHERTLLNKIFIGATAGETTSLASLRNTFYTAIPTIKEQILEGLKQKKVYRVDPAQANAWRLLGVALIAAPFILLQVLGIANVFTSVWLAAASVAVALFIVWIIGRQMSAKTFAGQRTYISVLGFQEFMNRVDTDRLKRMPPNIFEKYLPFAMALGVEQHWAKAFEGILQNPPAWYTAGDGGGMHFNPYMFTSNLTSMASQAHSAFVSAPRSSSSGSGFSSGGFSGGGGGFSGGGFGGGGGSAF